MSTKLNYMSTNEAGKQLPIIKDQGDKASLNTHNAMEYYGATVDERPTASSVPVGAVFMAVSTQEMWQSDGSQWVVI